MRSKLGVVLLIFYILGLIYLLLPSPPIPALPDSFKSDEPGDTGQIPNVVAAYYTNASREEVMRFYTDHFENSPYYNVPLIMYKFNHPPEYSKEVIVDTMESSFFEELVHPLREALFINGYYIETIDKERGKIQSYVVRDGIKYKNKITLYYTGSSKAGRGLIFSLIVLTIYVVLQVTISIIKSPWRSNRSYQS